MSDTGPRDSGEALGPGYEGAFVTLAHTPQMRLPHDRIAITVLKDWPTRRTMACIAALTVDGRRIATVGQDGVDGPTELYFAPSASSDADELDRFFAACRYRGEEVTVQRVLDALVDEVYLAAGVKHAHAEGETLLRLVDSAGHTRALRPHSEPPQAGTPPQPGDPLDAGDRWEFWTGTTWAPLDPCRPGHEPRRSPAGP